MSLWVLCRRFNLFGKRRLNYRMSSGDSQGPKTDVPSCSVSVDEETVIHLERLSLVDFANKRGIERLKEAIQFAEKLNALDTTGVVPLVTVLETEVLTLREDQVTEENNVQLVLSTASQTEEDYYIAPPGNIPLNSRDLNELK